MKPPTPSSTKKRIVAFSKKLIVMVSLIDEPLEAVRTVEFPETNWNIDFPAQVTLLSTRLGKLLNDIWLIKPVISNKANEEITTTTSTLGINTILYDFDPDLFVFILIIVVNE